MFPKALWDKFLLLFNIVLDWSNVGDKQEYTNKYTNWTRPYQSFYSIKILNNDNTNVSIKNSLIKTDSTYSNQ